MNEGLCVMVVATAFLIWAWATVGARCYVRIRLLHAFWYDDMLALVALVSFTIATNFVFLGVKYGIGVHVEELELHDFVQGMKYWVFAELIYIVTIFTIKCSIALYLLRIARNRAHRWLIYGSMGMFMVYSLGFLVFMLVQCEPISYFWDQFADDGSSGMCLNPSMIAAVSYGHSGTSVLTDFTLGLVPTLIVWDLQINERTKVSVAIILALGSFASAATIVRIPFIKSLASTSDYLFETTDVAILSTVEMGLGVIACSLATLKPLVRTFLDWGERGSQDETGFRTRVFGVKSTKGGYGQHLSKPHRLETIDDRLDIKRPPLPKAQITTIIEIEPASPRSATYHDRDGSSDGIVDKQDTTWFDSSNQEEHHGTYCPPELRGILKTTTIEVQSEYNYSREDGMKSSGRKSPGSPVTGKPFGMIM